MARVTIAGTQEESIRSPLLWILLSGVAALFIAAAWSGHQIGSDEDVLLVLPQRDTGNTFREQQLSVALEMNSRDTVSAAALAKIYIERARRESDPRYLGYAEHILTPWETVLQPASEILQIRAILYQAQHRFSASLKDLDSLLHSHPRDTQALLTRATVHQVLGEYRHALRDCTQLISLAPVLGATCSAAILSVTGRTSSALRLVDQIETQLDHQDDEVRQWMLTTMAEVADRAGESYRAENYYIAATATPLYNSYLLRSYSAFLLRNRRYQTAINLLSDSLDDDSLLLHSLIAAKAIDDTSLSSNLENRLTIRLRNAEMRKSVDHYYLAAYSALEFNNESVKALKLAKHNWARSKEIRDTTLLAKAAVLQNDIATVQEIRRWLVEEHAVLPAIEKLLESFGDFYNE